jgi:hypothetical protein
LLGGRSPRNFARYCGDNRSGRRVDAGVISQGRRGGGEGIARIQARKVIVAPGSLPPQKRDQGEHNGATDHQQLPVVHASGDLADPFRIDSCAGLSLAALRLAICEIRSINLHTRAAGGTGEVFDWLGLASIRRTAHSRLRIWRQRILFWSGFFGRLSVAEPHRWDSFLG